MESELSIPGSTGEGRTRTLVALAAWVAFVVIGRIWGLAVVRGASEPLYVDAVPFYGVWSAELTWRLVLAALVVGGLTVVLPRLAERLGWKALLVATAIGAIAVGLALAFVEPPGDAWRNIQGDYGRYTYLVDEKGPGAFLTTMPSTSASTRPTSRPIRPAWSCCCGRKARSAWATPSARSARPWPESRSPRSPLSSPCANWQGRSGPGRAAAFLVIAPAAVWHTNADVVFGGVALAGLAVLAVATGREGRRATVCALGGGALLGAAALLSHGLVLMAVPAVAVVVHRRRWRVARSHGAGALGAVAVPLLWGYSWLAGLASTKVAYDRNLARVRPYSYFVVGNLVAFAVAVGPVTAVALARLRDRGTWVLVGGGLGAVVLADLSGLSLAETERIWQPFMPLVLLAAGGLVAGSVTRARGWLALQAVTTVVLVAVLRSPW